MSVRVVAPNGVVREFWDDSLRTYTSWDPAGVQTSTRAYTPAENARADAEAVAATTATSLADIITKARNAQTANANYLALTSPTQAQKDTQLGRVTRELNALIKIFLGDLLNTDGT